MKLRGFSRFATRDDVLKFLSQNNIEIHRDSLKPGMSQTKLRSTGQWYIRAESFEQKRNLINLDTFGAGTVPIEIRDVSEEDAMRAIKYTKDFVGETAIILRGLPQNATVKDIAKFLNGYEVAKNGIDLLENHGKM